MQTKLLTIKDEQLPASYVLAVDW